MPRARQAASSSEESDEAASRRQPTQKSVKKRGRPSTQASRRRNDSDEEDSGGGGRNKGKTGGPAVLLSRAEQEAKSWDIARLALCSEFKRKPLTRTEINKEVVGAASRQFKGIFAMAQAHARTSLGMELVELRAKDTGFGVESSKKKKKKQNKKKQPRESDDSEDSDDSEQNNQDSVIKWEFVPGKQYILRSTFDKKVIAKAANVEEWPDDSHTAVVDVKGSDQLSHIGILYIILALILVSGREIPDDRLRSYLKKLGVMPNVDLPINASTAPSAAGKLTIEGLLRSFTIQGYLERKGGSKSAAGKSRSRQQQAEADAIEAQTGAGGGGDPNLDWRWGARADAEIGETNIGQFIEEFFEEPDADRARQKEISNTLWRNLSKAAGADLQVAQPRQSKEQKHQMF